MEVGEPPMVDKSLVIRLDGIFDLAAAAEIQRALAGLPDGAEVYVDLSQVREFHDRGVAVLADAIKSSGHPISVRGLRQHQYRMLRYLGVESAALDPGLSPRRGAAPPLQAAGGDGLA
jgi:anti-anti-sigma regulatory factor